MPPFFVIFLHWLKSLFDLHFLPKTPIPSKFRRTLEQNARNPHECSLFLFYSLTLHGTMFYEK